MPSFEEDYGSYIEKQLTATEHPNPEWLWVIALHVKLCRHDPLNCPTCLKIYSGKKPERREGDGSIQG
jgi:hypothetical protein